MGVEVCPVHKAEFKNLHTSSIHVGAMSYDSQPRGLKRKHPDDEEEEEDSSPSVRNQMHYNQMRQKVLNITYEKLSKFKQTSDCSLFHYVLLYNTVRSLDPEEGVRNGGSVIPAVNHQVPFDPNSVPPPDDPRTNLNCSTNRISPTNYATISYATDARTAAPSVINPIEAPSDGIFAGVGSGVNYSSEYDRYLMDLDGPSSGRATPFPPRTDVESGALWSDDSDRLTSLNWSSVLKMVDGGSPSAVGATYSETAMDSSAAGSYDTVTSSSSSESSDSSVSDEAMPSSETSLHTLMPAAVGIPTNMNNTCVSSSSSSASPNMSSASGSTSPISGSSPTSSEDEIFSDVDVALYDYDLMPLSPPNVRMAPVSAEELMWSLSNGEHQENGEHLTSIRT